MNKPSILVVDDEPNNFDVIETFLSNQDYQLHYVASGKEAITSLDLLQPHLILLDVMMPGMDGLQVCKEIKAMPQWSNVPIIMATALTDKKDLAQALFVGADDFISKPINRLELMARVHSMLRIKNQYDRIQSFSNLQRNTIALLTDNLQAVRGNIASSLPHELNTPLCGILSGIQFLIDGIDDMGSEEIHEWLDISYQSALRLEKLTQKFLNYLFLELVLTLPQEEGTAKDTANKSNNSSRSIFIQDFAATIAQECHRLEDLVCQIEDVELSVPSSHLQWIVNELLENAFKFSELKTLVTVRGEGKDGMFHLWISDRGRGMTETQIATLGAFMQFERQIYEQQGMGLGLKIAEKAVKLYGGRFLITSICNQETTVYLTLPLKNLI
ncbi:response regulator with CheY-like receiver domain and winged-helix DNA-binding domain (plasmid) [Synechococcus sp. PCC 7502]|uniref:hybrid sensor histidine kinase/response regulator n=1 Tax=Synechococcus sp. PCC 7502 TaxID=1173263 RepID=UPI00029F829D|nr:hybrid sensor histidine kinase/response regulator [Synechococcus sp. PCC 7502]AFY75481.1 response regulator with CheY-like receiver domain and winged-helix DNA-binding domain [Synechococcus sp. PCC 7502]